VLSPRGQREQMTTDGASILPSGRPLPATATPAGGLSARSPLPLPCARSPAEARWEEWVAALPCAAGRSGGGGVRGSCPAAVERAGGQRRSSRASSSSSRARLEARAHYHCYLDFSGERRRPRGTAGRCGGCRRGWHTSLTLPEGGLCTLLRDMLMHDSTRTRSRSSFSARSSSHSARRPTRPLGCSRGWSQGS